MLSIYDLKTEYRTNPYGIDALNPRFSWKIKTDRKGVIQKSYNLTAYCGDVLLWDSGEVISKESQRVRYMGIHLESAMHVVWQVKVTVVDENGCEETAVSEHASFTMGLLEETDWKCAWIEPEEEIDIHVPQIGRAHV